MKTALLASLSSAVILSCGAAPDAPPPATPVEAVDAPAAAVAEREPAPNELVVVGSLAEVDVRLEGDEVVLETDKQRHRFSGGRWAAEAKEPPRLSDPQDEIPGAMTTKVLPWTNGTKLLAGVTSDTSPFAFQAAEGQTAPDLSALTVKPWLGDFPEVAFATEPTSGRFYALGPSDRGDFGVFAWDAGAGASFTKLPSANGYAIYPAKIIARSASDVWAFASVTSGRGFGADFPGCPIIVRQSQDGGYVAHFDGHAWHAVAWPSTLRLDDVQESSDGTFTITTGWGEEMARILGAPSPRETWRLDPRSSSFTQVVDPAAARSQKLGWSIEDGVLRANGVVVALPDADEGTSYVPSRVVAVTGSDVFVLAKVMSGADDSGERVWLRTVR